MAIVVSGVLCPICNKPIDVGKDFFATTAFLEANDPLYRFSDAAMHWECYLTWNQRSNFASCYAEVIEKEETSNPFWHRLLLSDELFVRYGEIGEVDILLLKLAAHVRVKAHNVAVWLQNPSSESRYIQAELNRLREQLQKINELDILGAPLARQKDRVEAKKKKFRL